MAEEKKKKKQEDEPIMFYRTFDDEIVRIDPDREEMDSLPISGPRTSHEPIPVIPGYFTLSDAIERAKSREEIIEFAVVKTKKHHEEEHALPEEDARREDKGHVKGHGPKENRAKPARGKKTGKHKVLTVDDLLDEMEEAPPVSRDYSLEELNRNRQLFNIVMDHTMVDLFQGGSCGENDDPPADKRDSSPDEAGKSEKDKKTDKARKPDKARKSDKARKPDKARKSDKDKKTDQDRKTRKDQKLQKDGKSKKDRKLKKDKK